MIECALVLSSPYMHIPVVDDDGVNVCVYVCLRSSKQTACVP